MKTPKLVDDWKKCWKWFSVQSMAIAAAIQGAWMTLPDDMKASVPTHLVSYATMAILALGAIGRVIKQSDE